MQSPAKTVNMFGPIGGTDYLKLTMANKFKSKLRGNPMLTAMGANPIPGKPLPQQVSKNAVQMYLAYRRDGGQASVFTAGRGNVPVSRNDRELLKAAAEKLLSDRTFDDEYLDKTALGPLALLPAAATIGRLGLGAWRMASGAARAVPAAARSASKAFQYGGNTVGQSASAATTAAGKTLGRAAAKADPNAYKATEWLAGGAKRRLGPAASTVYNRGAAGLQGTLYGAGVDTGASILGYDTGGAGAMLGGAGGFIGSRPLRMLRYRMLGGPAGPASVGSLRQKMVGTGDGIADSLRGMGQRHAGKLQGLAGAGLVGSVQRLNSDGVVDATDPVGTFRRGQEFARDSMARGFGYEGGYGEMSQDVSPIIQDIRRTLQENQMRSGYAQR